MPNPDDIPNPLIAARTRVDNQLNALQVPRGDINTVHGVTKEAAILSALSARESEVANIAAAEQVSRQVEALRRVTERSSENLTKAMDNFTKATDDSSKKLAFWTKVMAWTTVALAVFALAQVVVAVLALFK